MAISTLIKQEACERLFHFQPRKKIARDLGVSAGSIRDWSIFIENNDFEWITSVSVDRKAKLKAAVGDWIELYPIGYSDVARMHGVRPGNVFSAVKRYLQTSPSAKLPLKLRHWKRFGLGGYEGQMKDIEKRIHTMVDSRLKSAKNEDELRRSIKEMLICYESLFEEVMKDCDELLLSKSV